MYPLAILCGGKATRLKNLSKDLPKSLIKFNDIPFLDYQLRLYYKLGVKEFYLCVGHFHEQISHFVKYDFKPPSDLKIRLSFDDKKFNGTGGAAKKVSNQINGPFFLTYGDSYLRASLIDIQEKYAPGLAPLITIFKNNSLYDASNCKLVNGKLIYKKNTNDKEFNYIDYGLGVYESSYFNELGDNFDLSKVQEKFSDSGTLQYYEESKRFFEIGSFEGIQSFQNYLDNETR